MKALDIKQNLELLGLTESESIVYTHLISNDVMSITELSKATDIPRTNIYRICENLVNKRLASWIIDQRGRKVKVVEPGLLTHIIEDKKHELEKVEKAVKDIQSIIANSSNKLPSTQIRYYKGKDGMKQLIWNTLKAEKETIGYSVYGRRKIVGTKFNNKFIQEFNKRKLVDRVIINKKTVPVVKKALRSQHHQMLDNVRVINEKDFYVSGDTYIYNNIYAVNFWNEKEIIGVEIENEEISKVQKAIFNSLWRKAKSLKNFK